MLILFFILFFTPCLADETLTITTYYPSPFGSYNELRAKKMAIGDDWYLADNVSWDPPCPMGGCTSSLTSLVVKGKVGIGTPRPDPAAQLEVVGQVKITGGNPGDNKVLTSDANGLASWQASPAAPSGAVMFFNLSTCPSGWSEFTVARGRYLVGGGTLGATVGTALSNIENRPTGAHTHTMTWGQVSGVTGNIQAVTDQFLSGTRDTGSAGAVAGTNAPYIQLLVCQKD